MGGILKIDIRDNNLIVFLNKRSIDGIDFHDKHELERYFRNLFLVFKDIYNLDVFGSYDINVYIDVHYGVVLEIINVDDSYFDYCDIIDMNICISKYKSFLYKLSGVVSDIDCTVYSYKGDLYYELNSIDFLRLGLLIENSEIIYGETAHLIKKNGKRLSNYLIVDKIL